MQIIGHTDSSDLGPINVVGDMVYVSAFTVTTPNALLSKLSARISGNGPANGTQKFRGVVYDESNALVATSAEVEVVDLSDAQWLDFVFDEPVSLQEQDYWFGLHASGPNNASTLDMAAPSYADTVLELGDVGYCLPLAGGSGLTDLGPKDADGISTGGQTVGGVAAPQGPLIYNDLGATNFDGVDDAVTAAPIDRINYCTNPNGREMFKNGWTALGLVAEGPLTIPMPTPSFDRLGTTDFDGVDDQITTAYTTRRNLCTNPNFETNTTSWTAAGATVATSTDVAYDGTKSAKLTATGAYARILSGDTTISATAGLQHTVSAYIYNSINGRNGAAQAYYTDSGGSPVGSSVFGASTSLTVGAWTRVTVSLPAAGVGTVYVSVVIVTDIDGVGSAADISYIDAILVEAASSAGTYFPTAAQLTSGDAGWTGTANASISEIGAFANGTSRTFSGWAWRDTNTTADVLIGSTSAGVLLRLNAGADTISFFPSNLGAAVTWAWPGSNQWVHWVLVFNEAADTAAMYINGALVSSQTQTVQWIPDPGAMTIGARSTIGSEAFDGKLAHIGVTTWALTLAQIQNLYTASTKGGMTYWATLNGFTKVSFYASLASGGAGLTDLSPNAWTNTAVGGVTVGGWRQSPEDDFGGTDFDGTDDRITTTYSTRRNYVTNPIFEVDTTGWANWGGGTIARTRVGVGEAGSFDGLFGFTSWAQKVVCDGGAAYQGANTTETTVPASGQYTASIYVKGPTGSALTLALHELTAASAWDGQTQTNFTATGYWQRVSVTRTFGGTGVKAILSLGATGTIPYTMYVVGAMIEASSSATTFFPEAAHLASGEAGWTGTAHASASDIGCFANGTTRTFMGWAYRDVSTTYHALLSHDSNTSTFAIRLETGSQDVNCNINGSGGGTNQKIWTAAWPGNGQWVHWAVVFNESTNSLSLYINGALVSTDTGISGQYSAVGTNLKIGARGSSSDIPFDGKQAWVSVHQTALTATQILAAKNASDYEAVVRGFPGCSILLALDSKNLATDLSGNSRNGTANGGIAIGGSYGITAGRSSAAARYSGYSISVKGDGVLSANKFIRPDGDWQTVASAAGGNLTVSAWLYKPASTTSSNATFYLYWSGVGSGTILCPTTWSSVPANTWTKVSATFAVPAGTTTGSICFAVPTEAVTAYWGGILIERSDSVGTYFDGDYALDSGLELVRWAGTANNSFSYGGKLGWHTRTNRFYNPNQPANAAGWNSYAGYATVTWDATESVYDSGHSTKAVCPGTHATEGLAIGNSTDPGSRWSPNKTYTVSVWVKGTAGQAMSLQLGDYNQYGGFAGGGLTTSFTTTGEWQRVAADHHTYDASYRASINLVTASQPAVGFTFYAGGALMEESPTMNSYFPTQAQVTSGEAGWVGAVELSESQTGAFSAGAKRTFMGWAKRTDLSTADCLIGSTHPSTPFIFRLEAGSQDVKIFPISGSSQTWTAAWPGNGVWTHWALTFEHTRGGAETVIAKLYINGAFVSSKTVAATIVMSGGAPTLGWRPSNTDYFNGQRAWESGHYRELTAAEIDYAADQGLPTTDADAYADGSPATLVPDPGNGEIGIFGTYAYPWTPPNETDLHLANLAYGSAQVAFKGEGDHRTRRRVKAAWHGTSLDTQPQGASLAVVQRDGAMSDLVGERLLVTSGSRSTIVYVHRETDLDLDDDTQISLSRRAWQALSPLAVDDLMVTTEVVRTAL